MNWKFTKVKTVISLCFSLLLGMFVFNTVYPIGGHPDLITFLFGFSGISIGFGLTYLIWSLIQKKEIVE